MKSLSVDKIIKELDERIEEMTEAAELAKSNVFSDYTSTECRAMSNILYEFRKWILQNYHAN